MGVEGPAFRGFVLGFWPQIGSELVSGIRRSIDGRSDVCKALEEVPGLNEDLLGVEGSGKVVPTTR